jgi:HK97 family phage portal protein
MSNNPTQKKQFRVFGVPIFEVRNAWERDSTTGSKIIDLLMGGSKTSSGESVNETTAMKFSAVYACVRIISETIASLPLNVYKKTDKLVEIDLNHGSEFVLATRPNDIDTKFMFWEQIITNTLLYGNGYARIYYQKGGLIPKRLQLLDPKKVTPVYNSTKTKVLYKVEDIDKPLPSDQMIHISGIRLNDIKGLNVVNTHKEAIGNGLAQQKFLGDFYGNNANFGGWVEMDGTLDDKGEQAFRESFNNTYVGGGKQFKTLLLEAGVKYHPLDIKLVDAEFIATSKFNIEEIARIYRVPLHLLQDLQRSTNNNIEQQSIDFVQHTLRPWIERIESELDWKLLLPSEQKNKTHFVEFDLDLLLRGDIVARMKKWQTLFNTGSISSNEIRAGERMNPYEGGDKKFVQSSLIPVEMAGSNFKTNEG